MTIVIKHPVTMAVSVWKELDQALAANVSLASQEITAKQICQSVSQFLANMVHGTCSEDVGFAYNCLCPPGWGGVNCTVDTTACAEVVCKSGGTCINIEMSTNETNANDSFTCNCSFGYAGTLCDMDVSVCQEEAPCTNGGTCTDGVGALYNCSCAIGYTGVNCTTDVSVCDTEAPCSNGGTCSDGPGLAYNCSCALGWGGVNCTDFLCECLKTHEYKHKTVTQVITSFHSVSMYTTSRLVSGMSSMSMSPSTTADLSSCNAQSDMNAVIFVVLSLSLATMVSSVVIIVILAWKLNSKPSECNNQLFVQTWY